MVIRIPFTLLEQILEVRIVDPKMVVSPIANNFYGIHDIECLNLSLPLTRMDRNDFLDTKNMETISRNTNKKYLIVLCRVVQTIDKIQKVLDGLYSGKELPTGDSGMLSQIWMEERDEREFVGSLITLISLIILPKKGWCEKQSNDLGIF